MAKVCICSGKTEVAKNELSTKNLTINVYRIIYGFRRCLCTQQNCY